MNLRPVENIYGRKVDGIPQAIKVVIVKNEVLDIFLMRGILMWKTGDALLREFEIKEESLDKNQGNGDRIYLGSWLNKKLSRFPSIGCSPAYLKSNIQETNSEAFLWPGHTFQQERRPTGGKHSNRYIVNRKILVDSKNLLVWIFPIL